jgi:hypothetical protein
LGVLGFENKFKQNNPTPQVERLRRIAFCGSFKYFLRNLMIHSKECNGINLIFAQNKNRSLVSTK